MTDKDDDNIRAIRPGVSFKTEETEDTPPEPNEHLVSLLETFLQDAKDGKLQELCYTTGYHNGYVSSGGIGECGNDDGMQAELYRNCLIFAQSGFIVAAIEGDFEDE